MTSQSQSNDALAQQYIEEYLQGFLQFTPTEATSIGVHTWDGDLEDRTVVSVQNEILRLESSRKQLLDMIPSVSPDCAIDCRTTLAHLDGQLHFLKDQCDWKRNPIYYNDLTTDGIFVLLAKNFAPLELRAQLINQRASKIPALLETAIQNLNDCPKIMVEKALELLDGVRFLFVQSVPEEFSKLSDQSITETYQALLEKIVAALDQYENFLRDDLLPEAKNNFALGRELFSRRLAREELVDIPLDDITNAGWAALRDTQQAFCTVAQQIKPDGDPREVFESMSREHPTAEELVPEVENLMRTLRKFLIDQDVVTIPSEEQCDIDLMPEFMWAFACIWPAGMLETVATGGEYYVAPVRSAWSPEKQEEHLQNFNYPALANVSAHEAWPGHFLESLYTRQVERLARKAFLCYSSNEGWAHYTEQMMIEVDYHHGDPKYVLAQLSDALLRLCRYVVAIGLHTGTMTLEEGIAVFEKEGYLNHHVAEEEAIRGTFDPMYLNYALGKLMLLKLRDDYRAQQGAAYTLKGFHNAFLSCGSIPIPLARELMLGPDNGSML
jgi:uncharacterized protein (DUF885 family)